MLTVADGGAGMDPLAVTKIFEPFFTTKPKGHGTGLGLSTEFGIVEQSGGHVRVRSDVGRGTTFVIFLPALSERPQQATELREPEVPGGSETILLAEDDEDLRAMTARALDTLGYRVLQAANGVDALGSRCCTCQGTQTTLSGAVNSGRVTRFCKSLWSRRHWRGRSGSCSMSERRDRRGRCFWDWLSVPAARSSRPRRIRHRS